MIPGTCFLAGPLPICSKGKSSKRLCMLRERLAECSAPAGLAGAQTKVNAGMGPMWDALGQVGGQGSPEASRPAGRGRAFF